MKDINATFHPRHVLEESGAKISKSRYMPICVLCDDWSKQSKAYCCPICEFYVHEECAATLMKWNLTIYRPETHEHTLTFIRKKNSFNCDACGDVDEHMMNIYGCLSCDFFVHKKSGTLFVDMEDILVSRRRVIINSIHIVQRMRTCGMVIKDVEGEPEEASILASPTLEEIDGKVLRHFSHEHDLMRLCVNDEVKDGQICQACILPIEFDSFVGCKECDFALHYSCAILPRKMEHALHRHPLILQVDMMNIEEGFFTCSKCDRESCGFMYRCYQEKCGFTMDAKCASLTNPIYHALHQHHPLSIMGDSAACHTGDYFSLNIRPLTLPILVKSKYDFHPLTLIYSRSVRESNGSSILFWCDICETIIFDQRQEVLYEPQEVFYRCADCNTTQHVECAIGKYPYLKSGHKIKVNGFEIQISSNNCSRPICHTCHSTCQDKLVFINKRNGIWFCSLDCITSSTKATGNLMVAG